MNRYKLEDTIAAISTPIGKSGIGIVRISGRGALLIADRIFLSKSGLKPSGFKTYTTHYGWIVANRNKDERLAIGDGRIDEVILTVMRQPKSYTKEDIVEINCHSGIIPLRKVLGLVLENGARLAQPGEFTKRAFLNGRIDLSQAEAILDIIEAKTNRALDLGISQLKGELSLKINQIGKSLLEILLLLEANVDFPEEEIGDLNLNHINQKLNKIRTQLEALLSSSDKGMILRQGLNVVICGKPNVGKSSLLNALLRQGRSIVTAIPGTTRDTIEEALDIKGILTRLVDTAGVIKPRNLIERKAVKRSEDYIKSADLLLFVFDGSRPFSKDDELLIKKTKAKTTIALINKIDLRQKIERSKVLARFPSVLEISAKYLKNIDLLENKIAQIFLEGSVEASEPILVSNLRHIQCLKKAKAKINNAQDSVEKGLSLEFIVYDLKEAINFLDEILGKVFSQDLLSKIFNRFCIGK
ncbi:MAG: tRNA uridine-5-carboxymethylaminomethyl(34) synthesis GTPase MnmE [Candidatus Omnitrophica bacterium]|nr:tRNA uridine-5-carboxymethylaminomethyl(34) synthesis GTPase MnmE [Candidatus Omnitrophota bacterium]